MKQAKKPWWRHPLLWMVLAGPAAAVLAGFAMLWLALGTPDPSVGTGAAAKPLMPALAGRNHAVTPAHDLPARQREKP